MDLPARPPLTSEDGPDAPATSSPEPARRWPLSSLVAIIGFVFVPAAITVTSLVRTSDAPSADIAEDAGGDAAQVQEPAARQSSIKERFESRLAESAPGRELAFELERATSRVIDDNYTGAVAATERVQLGNDGWLFLTDATAIECVTPEVEAQWLAEIRAVESLAMAAGKDLTIAIAPDRAVIAPEMLGPVQNQCERDNTAVVERLAAEPSVLNLFPAVSGESHALQLDSHWSPAGAMAGMDAVVRTIDADVWEERGLTSEAIDRPGDLDGLVGYDNTEVVNLITIDQPEPTTLEAFETSLPGRPLVQATTPGAADRHVLMMHDSFGGYFAEQDPTQYLTGSGAYYLRPWFRRVDNVRLAGLDAASIADPAVRESLAEADTLVFLFVQRRLGFRFSPGALSVPLAVALADQLGEPIEPGAVVPGRGVVVSAEGGVLVEAGATPSGTAALLYVPFG